MRHATTLPQGEPRASDSCWRKSCGTSQTTQKADLDPALMTLEATRPPLARKLCQWPVSMKPRTLNCACCSSSAKEISKRSCTKQFSSIRPLRGMSSSAAHAWPASGGMRPLGDCYGMTFKRFLIRILCKVVDTSEPARRRKGTKRAPERHRNNLELFWSMPSVSQGLHQGAQLSSEILEHFHLRACGRTA